MVGSSWHWSGCRMADNWIMGNITWLVLAICFSSKNAFCDISLNMEDSVTGVRGLSVKIPCTYTPSKGYEEVKVEWSFHTQVIIHRMESQDHIPLVNFRERVEISKSPAGDVSLTIMKLSTSDRGNIKCKVTWKKNDGTLTFKEDVTELKVLREDSGSSVDVITTREPDYETMKPTTEAPKENIIPTTPEELETMKPTTENPKENIITTTDKELETKNSHLDDGFRDSTVSPMESAEPTTIKESHESTTVITFYTKNIFDTNVPIPQKEGFRMPLHILIAFMICILCITAVIIVLVIKHRKRKGNNYELATMNQLLAVEGAGHRCQSNTDEARVTNTYEPCHPPPVSEYQGILATFSNEYEALVERSPENNCKDSN